MIFSTRRAAMAGACILGLLSSAQAQGSAGAGTCRQGVLALIVMIDAGENDKSHYRSTAASVVEPCGPAASTAKPASAPLPFDRAACGQLALVMLDSIEDNMANPRFVQARSEFAGRCLGR